MVTRNGCHVKHFPLYLERQEASLQRLPAGRVIHSNVVRSADGIGDGLFCAFEVRADSTRQPCLEEVVHCQSRAIRRIPVRRDPRADRVAAAAAAARCVTRPG